jgi:hypothetical protein
MKRELAAAAVSARAAFALFPTGPVRELELGNYIEDLAALALTTAAATPALLQWLADPQHGMGGD